MHLYGHRQRPARGIATDQLHIVALGQLKKAP
jgi:hypothetical protein